MARQPNPKPESGDPPSPMKAAMPPGTAADRRPAAKPVLFAGGPPDGRTISVDHPLPPELSFLAGVAAPGSAAALGDGPFHYERYRLTAGGTYEHVRGSAMRPLHERTEIERQQPRTYLTAE